MDQGNQRNQRLGVVGASRFMSLIRLDPVYGFIKPESVGSGFGLAILRPLASRCQC